MASSRCPYGPAHEQPPRAWMPNRSLSSATTKLWCRYCGPWRTRNETMDSRSACWLPSISMSGLAAQRRSTRRHSCCSRTAIRSVPTACLSANTSPARIDSDDRGGAALLARDRVVEILVPDGVDVRDGPAARDRRHRVGDQVAPDDQDAGRLRAADELVRGQEHRVLVIAGARAGGGDPDRHVGPGGGVVPERQRAMGVQQRGDRVGVGHDAGDVGGGREAADQQRPLCVAVSSRLQVGEVDMAVGVLADHHHLGDRLAPRQLVGVVLVRADEHDRPPGLRDAPAELSTARPARPGFAAPGCR